MSEQSIDQILHPWSCYRNEEGSIILSYEICGKVIAIAGITKKQITSLREELKAFELLDVELQEDLEEKENGN